jgi:hypothetical protein
MSIVKHLQMEFVPNVIKDILSVQEPEFAQSAVFYAKVQIT